MASNTVTASVIDELRAQAAEIERDALQHDAADEATEDKEEAMWEQASAIALRRARDRLLARAAELASRP